MFQRVRVDRRVKDHTIVVIRGRVGAVVRGTRIGPRFGHVTLFPARFAVSRPYVRVARVAVVDACQAVFAVCVGVASAICVAIRPVASAQFGRKCCFHGL